jgi:hypothetical protein
MLHKTEKKTKNYPIQFFTGMVIESLTICLLMIIAFVISILGFWIFT